MKRDVIEKYPHVNNNVDKVCLKKWLLSFTIIYVNDAGMYGKE